MQHEFQLDVPQSYVILTMQVFVSLPSEKGTFRGIILLTADDVIVILDTPLELQIKKSCRRHTKAASKNKMEIKCKLCVILFH